MRLGRRGQVAEQPRPRERMAEQPRPRERMAEQPRPRERMAERAGERATVKGLHEGANPFAGAFAGLIRFNGHPKRAITVAVAAGPPARWLRLGRDGCG